MPDLLPPDFCAGDALDVARELLGMRLVKDGLDLRITEVEAYRGAWDTASHSCRGVTQRTRVMFGPPGHAYVYLCYGIHSLLNVVTGTEGVGAAVLIRGVEGVVGPGRVGKALRLDPSWSGHPLFEPGGLMLCRGTRVERVLRGPRVGVDYARPEHRDAPWRLADADARGLPRRAGLR